MIQIDYRDKRPIYEQIVERIQQLIVNGVMSPNEKIPSVRNLAIDLSINPNTIQKAYQELERLGFIYTVKGKGNFVSEESSWKKATAKEYMGSLKEVLISLNALGVNKEDVLIEVQNIMKGDAAS